MQIQSNSENSTVSYPVFLEIIPDFVLRTILLILSLILFSFIVGFPLAVGFFIYISLPCSPNSVDSVVGCIGVSGFWASLAFTACLCLIPVAIVCMRLAIQPDFDPLRSQEESEMDVERNA